MRARIVIAACRSEPLELREVWLKEKPDELRAVSAKATVPVLVLPNGDVLDESIDIMHWALSSADVMNLGRVDDSERGAELVAINDNEFKVGLDRYKYADRHPECSPVEHRARATGFLKTLDDLLKTQNYLCGDSLSACDVAIFPFIRQFAMVDMRWFEQSEYVALHAWLIKLMASELFLSVMQKYPAWHAGTEPVLFPDQSESHDGR